jgi:hypothetical protein
LFCRWQTRRYLLAIAKLAIQNGNAKQITILNFFTFPAAATFGNPNAGGLNNGSSNTIKLEAAHGGTNYYTCATYGSPSPGANEHHHQQTLLATSAYSK